MERKTRSKAHTDNPSEAGPVARACARGVDSAADAEAEIDDGDVTDAEVEKVANAIETAAPKAKETIRDIILDHPEIRRLVVANAVRCLNARRWWYDSKRKRRVDEPDYQLRFRALEFLADRVDGRPAQALLNVNVNGNPNERPTSPENYPPAVLEALERTLERARASRAEPVENRGAGSPAAITANSRAGAPR